MRPRLLIPVFGLLGLLASAPGATAGVSLDGKECRVDSDYSMSLSPERLTLGREDGRPARIEMAGGRLWIDGEAIELDAADRERVLRFERAVRELAPEVRAITGEAIEIAYSALTEVAIALGDKPEPMLERLERSRAALESRLLGAGDGLEVDGALIENTVETLVGEFVPLLIGQITTAAVSAALSGDRTRIREIEARAETMEAEIERSVEAHADALKRRAEALCPKLAALDEIDDALEVRGPDGKPLALLSVR